MGTLRTGKGHRFDSQAGGDGRPDLDLDALMAQELDACTSVGPAAPVAPEQGRRTGDERMQEHTHLARLRSCAAIPLTQVAQGTGTTTRDDRLHQRVSRLVPYPHPPEQVRKRHDADTIRRRRRR
jgi:hypothetical protein